MLAYQRGNVVGLGMGDHVVALEIQQLEIGTQALLQPGDDPAGMERGTVPLFPRFETDEDRAEVRLVRVGHQTEATDGRQ